MFSFANAYTSQQYIQVCPPVPFTVFLINVQQQKDRFWLCIYVHKYLTEKDFLFFTLQETRKNILDFRLHEKLIFYQIKVSLPIFFNAVFIWEKLWIFWNSVLGTHFYFKVREKNCLHLSRLRRAETSSKVP